MKAFYVCLLATVLSLSVDAQVLTEDFESYAVGTAGSAIGYTDFSNGSSEVAPGAYGNATNVLLASNLIVGGDHYLRSPLFSVEENESYRVTLDISVTNTVYFIRIRTEDAAGNNTIMLMSDVALTTTNGSIDAATSAKIVNVTANTFGSATATFAAPPGAVKAQFQIYQFGKQSFMLDNILVEKVQTGPANWRSEAEQGTLSGAAFVASGCANASNAAFVRLESDNANQLTFGNVNVENSGSYELSIEYFYKSAVSYLAFYINGVYIKESAFLISPWCFEGAAGVAKVILPFRKGTNSVTIAPVQGKPSPFLDRLELGEAPVHQWFAEAESGSLIGGAAIASGCANASEQAFVRIDRSTDNGLLFDNVVVPADGYYKISFAYFGKGVNQSFKVIVNGDAAQLSPIAFANYCYEGGSSQAYLNTQLQAGVNTIEFRPIGGNILTPLIDWVEVFSFTPPIADLSLTKQRLEPGETIDIIVSTGDIPVTGVEVFSIDITGIAPAEYQLSGSTITLEPGKTEGVVQFTPNESGGEKEIGIAISTSSEEVIVNTAAVSAQITSIPQIIYVSSSEGDDSNDGFSEATPLRTLARASELGQITGDHVLFKTNDVFNGRLVISAGGTADNPIVISSYGTGEKPILDGSVAHDGRGSFLETIRIVDKSNVEISNLHITNPRKTSRSGAPDEHAYGILLLNDGNGVVENLVFRNLTVTDVFAVSDINQVPFDAIQVTGIFAETTTSHPGSLKYMDNILVEDCYFSRIGKLGFWSRRRFNSAENIDRDLIKNRNIIFRNNTVFQNGGSGLVLSNAYNALVESNTFAYTGSKLLPDRMIGRGSGAWFFSCTNVVAQHNISRHARGSNDSYGMHIDFGNKNVLFQYNYSEDSEGGFVEILGDNVNSIWRYNVSVNDGLREKKGNTLWISDYAGTRNITSSENYIYNNSVYVGNGLSPDISINANDAYIYNNIFQTENNSKIGEELLLNTNGGPLDVSNNLFFGDIALDFTQLDASAIQAEPKYVEPGKLEPDGYRLFKSSPAIKAGEDRPHPPFPEAGTGIFAHIPATPTTDFFGNPLVDETGESLTPVGAYAGVGLKVKNLKSYAVCDNEAAGTQQWLVINPNSFAVAFTWTHSDAVQVGVINAAPGNNFFSTNATGLAKEEMTIQWVDENGASVTKKLKSTDCYEDEVVATANVLNQKSDSYGPEYALKALFPNPIHHHGTLNLLLSAQGGDEADVRLVDTTGRVLYSGMKKMVAGDNLIQIDLSRVKLSTQLIFAQIEVGGHAFLRKVLIVD